MRLYKLAAKLKSKGYNRISKRLTQLAQYLPDQTHSRRFEVHISYPTFDENGSPYFDEQSVNEVLTVLESELDNIRLQDEKGFVKIHKITPRIPRKSSYID